MSAKQLDEMWAGYKNAPAEKKDNAKNALIAAMYREAWQIIWSKLKGAHPEIVNDSVTKAALYLDKFREEARFSSWFYGIVLSHCNTALRTRERRNEVSLDEMSEEELPTVHQPVLVDQLGLDPIEQRLLRLKAEGKTYAEIASNLGITRAAANSRWRRLQARIGKDDAAPAKPSAFIADSAG